MGAEEEMKSELRKAIEPLFSSREFSNFVKWLKEKRLPVLLGDSKEGHFNCLIDVIITDEDNILLLTK